MLGVLSLLRPSTTQTRLFTWTLPVDVVQWRGQEEGLYTLWVQKQPGTSGHPLTVRVRLPEGSTLVEATPLSKSLDERWVEYQTMLDQDRQFRLVFERLP
jgi:hypothetical protein